MEFKKYNKPVNRTKKKQTHRNREQTSGYHGVGTGKYRGGRMGDTNYWVSGRLKDVLYNMGNIANIL